MNVNVNTETSKSTAVAMAQNIIDFASLMGWIVYIIVYSVNPKINIYYEGTNHHYTARQEKMTSNYGT